MPSVLERGFDGARVLVTGHTGFKGAWLSAWLLELGAEPFGYALAPPTRPALFDQIGLAGRMDHRIGDVRDPDALTRRIREVRPDVIVHMAAQSLVREGYRQPRETFDTNVMGTANLLEAVRRLGRPCRVVVVTSDKCYESPGSRPCAEDDRLGGHDPYSASKGAGELVVSSYRRSFFPQERYGEHGVALATARAGNVIGGGDWAGHRLVPDIVRAVAAGRALELRNPDSVRPWQHVLDCLSGYLWLACLMKERGAELAEPWNFGPLEARLVPVAELAERFLGLWGREGWRPAGEGEAPHEADVLQLDPRKAVERLGWRPVWDIDTAINETVRWYRAERNGADVVGLTSRQIHEHREGAQRMGLRWALDATGATPS